MSERTGVTIIATPYELGTKHGEMAKKTRRSFERAKRVVQERNGLDAGENVLPVFYVGHSLGAKLHAVASFYDEESNDNSDSNSRSGSKQHFLVAFNNASATDSVKILEKIAKELLSKRKAAAAKREVRNLDAIFDRLVPFAEVAAKAAGLEFSPNALETLDGVANGKFKSDKVTLLSFTNDELDQCSSLEALADGGVRTNSVEIPGDHLSPVYLDLDKYAKMNPVMNRLSGVRIGDREAVERIANEMVKFLKS